MATKVTGVGRLVRRLKLLTPAVREAVSEQIIKGATRVQATAQESILRGPKTGNVYMKGKNKDIAHQASAPGEAPASDTGNLARRIEINLSPDKLRADIGVHNLLFTPYARALELGNPKTGLEARPFMAPALKKHLGGIRRGVTVALRKGVQGFKK